MRPYLLIIILMSIEVMGCNLKFLRGIPGYQSRRILWLYETFPESVSDYAQLRRAGFSFGETRQVLESSLPVSELTKAVKLGLKPKHAIEIGKENGLKTFAELRTEDPQLTVKRAVEITRSGWGEKYLFHFRHGASPEIAELAAKNGYALPLSSIHKANTYPLAIRWLREAGAEDPERVIRLGVSDGFYHSLIDEPPLQLVNIAIRRGVDPDQYFMLRNDNFVRSDEADEVLDKKLDIEDYLWMRHMGLDEGEPAKINHQQALFVLENDIPVESFVYLRSEDVESDIAIRVLQHSPDYREFMTLRKMLGDEEIAYEEYRSGQYLEFSETTASLVGYLRQKYKLAFPWSHY